MLDKCSDYPGSTDHNTGSSSSVHVQMQHCTALQNSGTKQFPFLLLSSPCSASDAEHGACMVQAEPTAPPVWCQQMKAHFHHHKQSLQQPAGFPSLSKTSTSLSSSLWHISPYEEPPAALGSAQAFPEHITSPGIDFFHTLVAQAEGNSTPPAAGQTQHQPSPSFGRYTRALQPFHCSLRTKNSAAGRQKAAESSQTSAFPLLPSASLQST